MHTSPTFPEQFDWSLMRSFLAVFEQGSLSAAARTLHVSQPTLSRHIAELETQLNAPLFERTGRGLLPTQAAHAIAEHAQIMAEQASAIRHTLSGHSADMAGVVRISASQTVATHLLPLLLPELYARAPGLTIELVASNQLSNLLHREADIAVRMVRPTHTALIARRIGHVCFAVYAHRDYLRRCSAPTSLHALREHALIGFDRNRGILDGLARLGVTLEAQDFCLRSDDHLVVWQALRAGLGIGFAATWLAQEAPELERVLPELAIPALPVWLVVHQEIHASARIRLVYDWLAERLGQVLLSAALD